MHRPYPNTGRALRHLIRQRGASAWRSDVVFSPEADELTMWAVQMRRIGNGRGGTAAAALARPAAAQRSAKA